MVAPLGLGVVWMDQLVPFHLSASVVVLVPLTYPTAMHPVAVHETPANWGDPPPPGLGVVCTVQVEPFHASASVVCTPPEVARNPTASQLVVDVHDTPVRDIESADRGVAWMLHVVPFHVSARVACALPVV